MNLDNITGVSEDGSEVIEIFGKELEVEFAFNFKKEGYYDDFTDTYTTMMEPCSCDVIIYDMQGHGLDCQELESYLSEFIFNNNHVESYEYEHDFESYLPNES